MGNETYNDTFPEEGSLFACVTSFLVYSIIGNFTVNMFIFFIIMLFLSSSDLTIFSRWSAFVISLLIWSYVAVTVNISRQYFLDIFSNSQQSLCYLLYQRMSRSLNFQRAIINFSRASTIPHWHLRGFQPSPASADLHFLRGSITITLPDFILYSPPQIGQLHTSQNRLPAPLSWLRSYNYWHWKKEVPCARTTRCSRHYLLPGRDVLLSPSGYFKIGFLRPGKPYGCCWWNVVDILKFVL